MPCHARESGGAAFQVGRERGEDFILRARERRQLCIFDESCPTVKTQWSIKQRPAGNIGNSEKTYGVIERVLISSVVMDVDRHGSEGGDLCGKRVEERIVLPVCRLIYERSLIPGIGKSRIDGSTPSQIAWGQREGRRRRRGTYCSRSYASLILSEMPAFSSVGLNSRCSCRLAGRSTRQKIGHWSGVAKKKGRRYRRRQLRLVGRSVRNQLHKIGDHMIFPLSANHNSL